MAMVGMHSSVFISKLPNSIHRFTNSPSSFSSIPCSRVPIFHSCLAISQVGVVLHPLWSGLRHKGVCIRHRNGKNGKNRRWNGRAVYCSLFGVGAPEALVIGVVALLVFGPRGLAEVARNLGKTIRSFQPTIRELQVRLWNLSPKWAELLGQIDILSQVSKEFKTTLQKEIGLDEVLPPATDSFKSKQPYAAENSQAQIERNVQKGHLFSNCRNSILRIVCMLKHRFHAGATLAYISADSTPPTKTAYSSEDLLKITEEQLKVVAAKQQITVGEQAADPSNGNFN
ncbi:hypothetical protein ACLOJK_015503 [Asimina triloba]